MTDAKSSKEVALEIESLDVSYGDVKVVYGINLSAQKGQHLTLVGPSGCGKTTILRSIAGLETPTGGRISLFGRVVFDAVAKINVPTEARDVSMVFQSYAIWPHMTVFENIAYGLRLRKMPKGEIEERVRWALDLVGMGEFIHREAPQLSGGQQQRVALARSFVFNPTILLFDEPLSNLDAKLRAQMRVELKELTSRLGVTSVYVTHDQEEALSLSDLVAVLDYGKLQQLADPLTTYFRPANAFVSNFMGTTNLLRAQSKGPADLADASKAELENGKVIYCSGSIPVDEPGVVTIKSVHLRFVPTMDDTQLNVWQCRILSRMFVGDFVEYELDWDGLNLRARDLSHTLYDEGQVVYCQVLPEHATILPPS